MLLKFTNVDLSFGAHPLLKQANLTIKSAEKVCLIGKNSCGKSSLFKLITGDYLPDDGTIWRKEGCKIGILTQDIPPASTQLVYDFVAAGLTDVTNLLNKFDELTKQNNPGSLAEISLIQQQIDALNGWQIQQQVENIIKQLELPANKKMNELSGGWRRRALLAQVLVKQPDLLLLDEPTNHLDIGAILWLEKIINNFNGTVFAITHDRTFLQNIANHIVWIDRGALNSWHGDYQSLEQHRINELAAEETRNNLFDKKLAEEEKWIRTGIKARRTRNEGRVRNLKEMRKERAARINIQNLNKIAINLAAKSGKQVIEAKNVNFGFISTDSANEAPNLLIKDFNFLLTRGDRVGLLGANGSGKSTLLKLLLGELKPISGTITTGTKLKVAYFDQMRSLLNPNYSVLDNLAEGQEFIEINGKSLHVMRYLNDFMFTAERARSPISCLSGGEIARLCLAKLFSSAANLLVLDEPTNDLDIETLELLEQSLLDFPESVLLISHDRSFLDNLVTSTLVFTGNGQINEYVGGFNDWLHQGGDLSILSNGLNNLQPNNKQHKPQAKPAANQENNEDNELIPGSQEQNKQSKTNKLSYKLKFELENLPQQIQQLEQQITQLNKEIADPNFFKQNNEITTNKFSELHSLQQTLEVKMNRWLELEELNS